MDKGKQLQWLSSNADKVDIQEIYPNGQTGKPTLLIEFVNWNVAEISPFESRNCCIVFE